jgi:hypothetical protein
MNLWTSEPAKSPYEYTLLAPAEPVMLAHTCLAARAIQLKWNRQLKWNSQPSS